MAEKSEKHRQAALMRRRVTKECEWCGEEYEALATSIFCSNRCRQANKYDKKRRMKS